MLRKFLNNNFGFSGLEVLKSQNTGKEIKLLNIIEAIERKGQAVDIIDNIKIHCTDDDYTVKWYLVNQVENLMEG